MDKLFSKVYGFVASFAAKARERNDLYVDLLADDCREVVLFFIGTTGDRISILRRRDRYILRIMAFEDNRVSYVEREDVIRIYNSLEKSLDAIDSNREDFSCDIFDNDDSKFEIFVHRVGHNIYLSKHFLSMRFRACIDRKSIFDAVNALQESGFI